MSRPPRFDDTALRAVLGGPAPAIFDRSHRVRLLGEAAVALIEGRLPSRAAALFLGGALLAWLENGGSLERDFFKVVKPKSHHTPSVIWQQIQVHQDERHDADGGAEFEPTSTTSKTT